MSYMERTRDVMTLAHELGHGVHASLSRGQNIFNFHGTLPMAELASTFGEMLVFENLVKSADLKEGGSRFGWWQNRGLLCHHLPPSVDVPVRAGRP